MVHLNAPRPVRAELVFPTAVSPSKGALAQRTSPSASSGVFGLNDSTTRSKYYGNQRAKDLAVHGATGSGLHSPYALVFTISATSAVSDVSWMSGQILQG